MRLLAPALCLALASPALADPAEGQKLLDQAESAIRAGDTTRAVLFLQQAYAADPDPRYIANLGIVYERSGQYAEAVAAFERYLESNPEQSKRSAAESALARLRPEGVIVSTPSGAEVRIDGEAAGQTPIRTRLLAGAHAVAANLDGHLDEEAALRIEPGEAFRLELNLRPVPVDPAAERRASGYLGLAVGGAAVVGAGVLAWLTTSEVDAMDAATDRTTFDEAQNRANLYGWGAIITGVAGVTGMALGGYLIFTAEDAEVQAQVGPLGVGLSGRF